MGKTLAGLMILGFLLIHSTSAHATRSEKSGVSSCSAHRSADKWFECISKMGDSHVVTLEELPRVNLRYRLEVRTKCDAGALNDVSYAKCLNDFIQSKQALNKVSCFKLVEPEAFDKCIEAQNPNKGTLAGEQTTGAREAASQKDK